MKSIFCDKCNGTGCNLNNQHGPYETCLTPCPHCNEEEDKKAWTEAVVFPQTFEECKTWPNESGWLDVVFRNSGKRGQYYFDHMDIGMIDFFGYTVHYWKKAITTNENVQP